MAEALVLAIDDLDAARLRTLLQKDPAASNATDDGGRLLLHLALDCGSGAESTQSLEVIRCLLDFGASAEALDGDGQGCALHVACGTLAREPSFALPALTLMLQHVHVALDSLMDSEGSTALAVAVQQGKQLTSEPGARLAGEQAITSAVERLLEDGCGLLQYSAPDSQTNESKAGEDDSGGTSVGRRARASVLHVATEWSPLRCVELLLQSPDALEALRTRDEGGDTPLRRALAAGRSEAAQLLLSAFPHPPLAPVQTPGEPGATEPALHALVRDSCMHPARRSSHANYGGCVRLMLEKMAHPVDERGGKERTALALGMELGCAVALARELLTHGARVDAVDAMGRCAAMIAAAHGRADLLSLVRRHFPSLPFPSLPFPPSLPLLSFPFLSLAFPCLALPCRPSLPFLSLPFLSL